MTAPTTIDGDVMLTDELQSNPLFEALKLAVGMLSLHGHEDDAKKVATEARALLSASKPSAMPGKDAVTREQIEAWAKLAGIPTMFEKHIEQLGDFAIFARMDYAASPAAPAQSGEPVAWFHNTSPNGDKPHYEQVADEYARPPAIPLYTAPQSSQPVEAGDPCEHCKVNRPYHDLDCPVAAKVLAEKSAVVLDDERAAWNTAYEKGYADGWSKGPYARAASPQATVYSLFSSSDRRNFGHLAPQEFVNAVIEAVRAQATATQPAQTERALTDDAHDAARYQWLRAWYLRDGLRAEIHPLGYITPTTTAIIDEAIDAALTAAQPASGGDQQQAQEG